MMKHGASIMLLEYLKNCCTEVASLQLPSPQKDDLVICSTRFSTCYGPSSLYCLFRNWPRPTPFWSAAAGPFATAFAVRTICGRYRVSSGSGSTAPGRVRLTLALSRCAPAR